MTEQGWTAPQANQAFSIWTSALFAFRAAHPALRPAQFFDGTDHDANGLPDVAFLDDTGSVARGIVSAESVIGTVTVGGSGIGVRSAATGRRTGLRGVRGSVSTVTVAVPGTPEKSETAGPTATGSARVGTRTAATGIESAESAEPGTRLRTWEAWVEVLLRRGSGRAEEESAGGPVAAAALLVLRLLLPCGRLAGVEVG